LLKHFITAPFIKINKWVQVGQYGLEPYLKTQRPAESPFYPFATARYLMRDSAEGLVGLYS